jgi:hypothetical protein
MATPLKVLTALSASFGAAVSGSSGLKVQQGGVTVESGNISGSADLTLAGSAGIGGDLTVAGNLTINGTTTTLNTENLVVEDYNIVLGNVAGGASDATADGGGIILSGTTNKTLTWNDNTDSWTSSENLNLAADKSYKLAGTDVLKRSSNINIFENSTAGNVHGNLQISNFGISTVSGSAVTRLQAPLLQLSGTFGTQVSNDFSVLGTSILVGVNAQYVTASVGVSASVFVLADGTQLTSSTQLGGGGGGSGDATKSGINTEYASLRLVLSGTLDANGHADVNITDAKAGKEFPITALHSCSIDVLTDTDGTGWTNDLVSVRLEVSDSKLYVKIDAPAAPIAGYRLIAVNEADFNLV